MSASIAAQDHLNGYSYFILVVFIVVSFFVIFPVRIPLPAYLQRSVVKFLESVRIISHGDAKALSKLRLGFPLSLATAPVVGVVLLLATTTIHGSTIELGIKGDGSVKPYNVLVLFISLAYISIALDGTGALEAMAFWVSKRGGSSGPRLFAYLYAFFLLTGCIVGNDPLILSGTPFLAYLTLHTGIEPSPWIFSEFIAANTASAVLVSSNPTNVLIAGSFSLNYLTGFTKWTVLPVLIPSILNYPLLLLIFGKRIPKSLPPVEDNPWSKLRDARGAAFLSLLLLGTVGTLVGTSFVPGAKVEVWMVTAPAGIIALLFNVISDWWNPKGQMAAKETEAGPHPQSDELKAIDRPGPTNDRHGNSEIEARGESDAQGEQTEPTTIASALRRHALCFPGTTQTILRLPIPLLPFAMCEFIMVRGLAQRGWITIFAHGFAHACTSPASSVFFMGCVSAAFLCPLAGTNIGATIILVEIMRDPAFAQSTAVVADHRIMLGAIYAVALGSNLGAFSYTFAGSLAGLLWRDLLSGKGVHVSQTKFALVNAVPLVMQTIVACAVILGQLYWFS